LAVFVVIGGLSGCSGPQESKDRKVELETFNDKISYVLGIDIGSSLLQTGTEINLDVMYKGIEDSINDRELMLGSEETEALKLEFSQKLQEDYEKKIKESGEKNLAEGKTFLEDNKKKEGVVTTESGLQYKVMVEGDGALPASTDKVKVHYRGTLIDGKEFDSSYSRGEPVTFQLDSVIPGWVEALQLMKVGSKYQLFIPQDLAYGEREVGPDIEPYSTLIFEVELIGIE
jgi:FKBP-type peptidyl-prolyl cis-trans isomerase